MLPVVICEPDNTIRRHWMDVLNDVARRECPSLKMEVMPGEERELNRVLKTENGIILVILAVTDAIQGGIDGCIELFHHVMEHNRDSYAVLCIHDAASISTVLSRCMRPGGILLQPFQEELMRTSLKRILKDYAALHLSGDDADYMVVNAGKTVQRIAYRDILYLEAQDKLLNINMERQAITVRASLNALAETLPEGFIRCHRSYIVNQAYVERLSLADMELHLTTQERLPISRSYKETLRERFQAEGWI